VWPTFQERFGVTDILEFYGSTEGNVSMFNFDSMPGAVGRVPFYLQKQFNFRLVKLDLETEQPVRGADGLCQPCAVGEIGETIGRISDDARSSYTGYVDKAASEKKILRDVFEKGDAWFRTGDLMRQDGDGYFYFVDRLGDTFRWKGENVSTTEVAAALTTCGVQEANVYGVAVPGHDGRAGMAALVAQGELDLDALYACLERSLPSYARPLFLRVQNAFETTGTFKLRKVDLVREGFDPAQVSDPLYFSDPRSRTFKPLCTRSHAEILSGAIRV
jgi:fatty-acyl-CoA synthase